MSRNNGIYSLPSPPMPLVPDTLAMAEDLNTTLSDIAAAITGSMALDGSTPFTGPVNFNGQNVGGINTLTVSSLNVAGGINVSWLDVTSGASIAALSGPLNANNQNITGIYNLTAAEGTVGGITMAGSVLTAPYLAYIAALSGPLNANEQNIVNVNQLTTNELNVADNIAANGQIWAGGNVVAGNGNVSLTGGSGIIFNGIGPDLFNFRWDGLNAFYRVDNAVDRIMVWASDTSFNQVQMQPGNNTLDWVDSVRGIIWGVTAFTSDPVLKTNIEPSEGIDSLSAIVATELYEFDWRESGEHVPLGFLSTSLRRTLPDCLFSLKQPEGKPPLDFLRLESLVAHLFRAVQQLAGERT